MIIIDNKKIPNDLLLEVKAIMKWNKWTKLKQIKQTKNLKNKTHFTIEQHLNCYSIITIDYHDCHLNNSDEEWNYLHSHWWWSTAFYTVGWDTQKITIQQVGVAQSQF